ncbi:Tfp pilus assembly protein PilF [Thermoanaerobacterium sp. RBIITD]|nr:Tfp pilus assembly protein PilF [Thermoanaerobacterium sp. RBIITD]
MMNDNAVVKMWEEEVEIPTYPIGKPNKNPMFLEKRVYQGSSGKVYPYPVIDKIYDEKVMKKYKIVCLENEYLLIEIMPELGGRIYRALDKTNNYDFIYYNRVIKPALVGLAGPWISGGIEFNWPQHHRPNTFGPVEYYLKENEDGSKTVWVSEIDKMYGTKGMAGFTLYPGKAYLEIKGQLYNRTEFPQTFLWWANPAVAVNDDYQSVFPPDVHAVFDHGKRDVSRFPIATGEYYKIDYSKGVDISRYKNIPVPTSYMAYRSDFDFVGGYDHSKKAGILHIADHHVSPGKKQWTWGNGDFGKAWERNLTDEDGPYIELMTGVYTDNQPDFSWLMPGEEKTFKQYFMPYKEIGIVKNATINAAVNLEVKDNKVYVDVYATQVFDNATIKLEGVNKIYLNTTMNLSPVKPYSNVVDVDDEYYNLKITVYDNLGNLLVSYKPIKEEIEKIPDPAKAIPEPAELKTNEALYLAGLHLEQYRHATYEPDDYYLEGLKRDPDDIRINNAYGLLLLRRGKFEESEKYFRRAIKSITRHNPNPYDGEPYYNLGLSLKFQGKFDSAYDAFYKSTWNNAWQNSGYFALAQIACEKRNYCLALDFIEKSIIKNYHDIKARNLKTAILRKLGRLDEAKNYAYETQKIDLLDFGNRNELYLVSMQNRENEEAEIILNELNRIMRDDAYNYINLALDYANAYLYDEAIEVLKRYVSNIDEDNVNPMAYYYISYFEAQKGNNDKALDYAKKAASVKYSYCFPNKIEDIKALKNAIEINPDDSFAYYYLGMLWYDKKQYEDAKWCFEKSIEKNPSFPTAHRNLALYYYNKAHDHEKALKHLERAFELDKKDSRVLLELDQLYKKLGYDVDFRLKNLEDNIELVEERDDLYIEYITLINQKGEFDRALKLLEVRKFHPWEGGEGKVTGQYVLSHVEIAKRYIENGEYKNAIEELAKAKVYPENLGEGKLIIAHDNNINYYLGCCYEGLGEKVKAREYFEEATMGMEEPAGAMYYNDQPADMIFYQGLAYLKLGNDDKAKSKFNKLLTYGEKHIFDDVKIDYFAVSLPDFLIFDEDLNKKNQAFCYYLIGLGHLGLGNKDDAVKYFKKTLEIDKNHMGALIHIKLAE